jgi:hypothetical protein
VGKSLDGIRKVQRNGQRYRQHRSRADPDRLNPDPNTTLITNAASNTTQDIANLDITNASVKTQDITNQDIAIRIGKPGYHEQRHYQRELTNLDITNLDITNNDITNRHHQPGHHQPD